MFANPEYDEQFEPGLLERRLIPECSHEVQEVQEDEEVVLQGRGKAHEGSC